MKAFNQPVCWTALPAGWGTDRGRLIGPAVMLSGRSSVKEVRGQELDGTRRAFQRWTGEQMESRRVRLRRWTASPSQTLQNKDKKKAREHRVCFKVRFFFCVFPHLGRMQVQKQILLISCDWALCPPTNPQTETKPQSMWEQEEKISVAFSWK